MAQTIHIQDDIARMSEAGVLDALLADRSTGTNIFAELEEPTPPNPRGHARIFDWTAI